MSVNALLYEREQEPEFFAKKCRRCGEPVTRCECEDDEPASDEFSSVSPALEKRHDG